LFLLQKKAKHCTIIRKQKKAKETNARNNTPIQKVSHEAAIRHKPHSDL
jgi:hypothetical protein